MIWRPWVIAAGVGLVTVAFLRKKTPKKSMRVKALGVALSEDVRWGEERPSTEQVDSYLAGVQPHGRDLVLMNDDTNIVNFCAAAVGWCEHQTGMPDLPPWRSGAKQIMFDSQDGLRGAWHPASELRSGWRPPPGALAVYHRGDPDSPFGHVDRVIRSLEPGYESVGANEQGRRWDVDLTLWTTPALLGFVVDDEPRLVQHAASEVRPPVDLVETPLTPEERAFIRGFA